MSESELRKPSEPHDAIEQRAVEFFQRQRFWNWSNDDQAELDAWLAESDFHQVAYMRIEAGAERVERLAALGPPKPGEGDASAFPGIARRIVLIPLLAAASIALAVTIGFLYTRALVEPPPRMFATNVGGRAHLKFADGTEIELNTNTALRYRMTTRERTVWLDRGEAYFRVAHNASNPFAVIAAGHRITDLGTEFLVRETGSLDVVLVKGRAQLASENPGTAIAMLTPGDEVLATPRSTTITKETAREIADTLAWRRGVIVFRNTRLADAVREFNRYNATKLVIVDPSIDNLKFGGEVRTDNIEDFLHLAQTVLGLGVVREANEILLSRTPEEAKRAAHFSRGLERNRKEGNEDHE